MPVIQRSTLVPHSCEAMFDLVADVERYPEFLPFCSGAHVLERTETVQVATVRVSRRLPGLGRPEFTTRNRLERPTRIDVNLENGPFRYLRGTWRFVALDEAACRAELEVNFEFKSHLAGRVLTGGIGRVCDAMVSAFVKRAAATLPRAEAFRV